MVQILLGILILGILVVVHELGHFLAAKSFKIRVLSFSIGFGKVLFHKTFGGTDYRISAIPFGGYVNMAGEYPTNEHKGAPDEYFSKPVWQRCIVAAAGPAFNVVFAIAILWIMFLRGESAQRYMFHPIIGEIADSSASALAGFQIGDSVIAINGKPVSSWIQIEKAMKGTELSGQPNGGLYPPVPARIDTILPDLPASRSDLKKGDLIVSVNDVAIKSWAQFSTMVSHFDSSQISLRLTVDRDGTLLTVTLTPEFDIKNGRYMIGVSAVADETVTIDYSLAGAFKRSLEQSWEYTTMIYVNVSRMIAGPRELHYTISVVRNGEEITRSIAIIPNKIAAKDLSGPIGIVQVSGGLAMMGFIPLITILALISINLAVLNLVPFLIITDGGQIMFFLIEAIRGKPLQLKTQSLINRIAIAFFVTLFLYITYHDILRVPQFFKMFRK